MAKLPGTRATGLTSDNIDFFWKDDNFPAINLSFGASPPDTIAYNGTGIGIIAFDGAATSEEVYGGLEYNHDAFYGVGAVIKAHVHWCPVDTNAGNVKWNLEYNISNTGDVGTSTTVSVVSAAGGVAWATVRASFPDVSISDHNIGAQIGFRLYRDPMDAEDTYGSDAAIKFTIGFHYLVSSPGSRLVGTK